MTDEQKELAAARTDVIIRAVNLMTAICRESNIPFDVYVQACVLNYRAVRRTHPNLVRATEEVCDVADNKQNPGGN